MYKLETSTAANAYNASYTYTYDSNGNILSVKDKNNKTTSYAYDSANQLVRENNQAQNKTWVYAYDNAGNIENRKEYAYTTGTLGTVVDTVDYVYGDTNWGDLLTKYDGQTISYDEIGNPTSYYNGTHWSMTWEHGRELTTISDGTTTWTNTYNADGLRTKRTNGTKTYNYVYLGDKLIQMHVGDDILKFGYDASGSPMYLQFNNSRYFYATNAQGDVMALVHTSGTAVVEYTYDAWGNILTTTGSMAGTLGQINPLRYRGYVYDQETGLYYLQSRYYDPVVGRFLNADGLVSTGQGLLGNNMFAYCRNNPILRRDQNGHSDENSTNDQNNSDDLYELRGTISFGVSLNVSLFGFWGFGGQLCISLDLYGNAQIQGSLEGGLTTGDASSSLMVYTMVTNAPTVDKLNGPGYQVGGTIPIGPTTAVGYDSNILEDKEENTVYTGSTFSVGKVLPGASPEVHVYWGETSPTTSFSYDVDNFWDVLYRCITGGYQ